MSVKAVRYLLANYAPLTAVVRVTDIMAGPVLQGIAPPAISVKLVSRVDLQNVGGPSGFYTSRVQVTVMAATYPSLRQVMGLVRSALPRSRGTVNGVHIDSVVPDVEGPDFADEENGIFFASFDFMVRHTD